MRRRVVLPEPDGPRRATSDPLAASTVTPSRAVNRPNRLTTLTAAMLMRDPGCRPINGKVSTPILPTAAVPVPSQAVSIGCERPLPGRMWEGHPSTAGKVTPHKLLKLRSISQRDYHARNLRLLELQLGSVSGHFINSSRHVVRV